MGADSPHAQAEGKVNVDRPKGVAVDIQDGGRADGHVAACGPSGFGDEGAILAVRLAPLRFWLGHAR